MLSIIICSRDKEMLAIVSENVNSTIGVPYEIVAIDNQNGMYGICQAYNMGAQQSKNDILCFMHEDILFHTQNWGVIVAEILKDKTIGLVGVTGSKYLVKAPAPWWGGGMEFCRRNILERYADNTQERILQNPENQELEDVVAVDGLWLCTRKEVWQAHQFDEKTFPFFHLYDLDFSVQIFQKYRVCVTFNILIEHFSRGNFNKTWITSALSFADKWRQILPLTNLPVSEGEKKRIEARACQGFVSRLVSIGYNKATTLRYCLKCLAQDPFNRDNLWLLKQSLRKF